MKPVGWTFQTPSPSASAAPEDAAQSDAGRGRGGSAPTSGEQRVTKVPVQGSTETSAEEVNSRINRILMIVKNPSTAKEDGENGQQRNGHGRNNRGANRRGKQNNAAGSSGGNKSANSSVGSNAKVYKPGPPPPPPPLPEGAEFSTEGNGWEVFRPKAGEGDERADRDADAAYSTEGFDSEFQSAQVHLNPHAPIFVPNATDGGNQEYFGYPDANWSYMAGGYWGEGAVLEDPFPEVIMGSREDEFIGLQCIAEMGEWVVLRENKPKCLPFFWSRVTGEKTWEEPPSIKDMGVADLLKKWSVELPETGIEPLGPEAALPDHWDQYPHRDHGRRGGGRRRQGEGRGAATNIAEHAASNGTAGSSAASRIPPPPQAPPGFDGYPGPPGPSVTRRRDPESNANSGSGAGGGSRSSRAGAGRSGWKPKNEGASIANGAGADWTEADARTQSNQRQGNASWAVWRPKGAGQSGDDDALAEDASGRSKDAASAPAVPRVGRNVRAPPDMKWQRKVTSPPEEPT